MCLPRAWLAMWTAILLAPAACAHDVWRSESKIETQGRQARVTFTLNLRELRGVELPANGAAGAGDVDRISAAVRQHYALRSGAPPLRTTLEGYRLIDGHVLQWDVLYEFERDVRALEVTSTLHQIMQPGHQHLMTVRLNGTLHEQILDAASPTARFSGNPSPLLTVWRFLCLGVEHIFTGYDHLAFLLGLMIAATSIRSLVKIVTAFTIAHSLTLALATYDVVILPTRLTESLIALSIVYVAVENLLGIRAIERHYVAFLFGLVHGFGFSNVLREMQLPRGALALSLFSFNTGVEIAQVVFVVLLFPAIQDLGASRWRSLRPAVSVGVACLAAYWFVQRAFL